MTAKDTLNEFYRKWEKSKIVRGHIIDRTIEIENVLNIFLARYFCDREEIYYDFIKHIVRKENFTFGKKIILFSDIGIHRKKEFKGKYKGLTGRLDEFRELRNYVAHVDFDFYFTNAKFKWKGEERVLDKKFLEDIDVEFQDIAKIFRSLEVNSGLSLKYR